jgi:hypothetical protein
VWEDDGRADGSMEHGSIGAGEGAGESFGVCMGVLGFRWMGKL